MPPVHKLQIHVQNVIQVIIQVEVDALLAQQFMQNVHHAPKQRKHVPLVPVVIMLQEEPVLHVLVKWLNVPPVPVMEQLVRNVMQIIS